MSILDKAKYETEYVKGDSYFSKETGITTVSRLDTGRARVEVVYQGKVGSGHQLHEVDVYDQGNGNIRVVMFCPRCQNTLTIDSANKAIEFDPRTKKLSVEVFECTWEWNQDSDVFRSKEFGMSLCRFRGGIYQNRMKDA